MRQLREPWLAEDGSFPPAIFAVKGMIGQRERKMLYSFAREGLEGVGQVVDAGAFLGSSALCLAAGLSKNANAHKIFVHCYDLFTAQQPDIIQTISTMVRPTARGDSYLDIFQAQTFAYREIIKTFGGDFCEFRWSGRPIELLFVDICKSPQLNNHLLENFFPRLVPGKSLVIHQNFLHVWHPYIHWSMQILEPYFEIEANLVDASRVFRLVKAIPKSEIRRITQNEVSPNEKIGHLRRLAVGAPLWQQQLSEALVLRQMVVDEQWNEFEQEWREIKEKYGDRIESKKNDDWIISQGLLVYQAGTASNPQKLSK